jgi:hypothetical protein
MRVRALAMDENAFVGPFKLNALITTRLEEVRMIVTSRLVIVCSV